MRRITDLEVDDEVAEKLAVHRVTVPEVRQVVASRPVIRKNRRGRGRIEVVGRTRGGRVLLISLAPTSVDDVWRPVTAYDAPAADRKIYGL